ncbi:hypothetical protein DPEC_G00316220 [Dallia pectoralis]|uniref:Uncharacterized protein n=1 Tax=Dallia pectoralis TaxID=75939 RepID=A0ACC2FCN9_DALPE|nr:hypothetical protein DPEC_G00316220 [Dallia pectoralis]
MSEPAARQEGDRTGVLNGHKKRQIQQLPQSLYPLPVARTRLHLFNSGSWKQPVIRGLGFSGHASEETGHSPWKSCLEGGENSSIHQQCIVLTPPSLAAPANVNPMCPQPFN